MPPALIDMLSASLAARRRTGGSLMGTHLWQVGGKRLLRTVVDSEVRRIERHTKIEFSPHALRHYYYGASLISAGVPVPQVAKQIGHASAQVTMRVYAYAMADDEVRGRAAVAAE